MQGRFEEKLGPDQDSASEAKMSRDLQEQLRLSNDSQEICTEERKELINDHDHGEDEEEEEFSFMCGEGDASPIAAEDAFINGKIRSVFPLFNRDLFFSGGEQDSLQLESLPSKPLVKVFVETKDSGEMTSSSKRDDEIHGPYCEWSSRKAVEVSPETCKKSNSTGFSKLWRFKELMGRSNSDGRDTFVFLNNGNPPPTAAETVAGVKVEGKVTAVKVKKGGKSKTASLSAHEVYLKSKAREEEKRRSYLPYRPELMGFFTNTNSGLSKNVHPF